MPPYRPHHRALGSISHGVLRRAGRPVLVVKAAKTAPETTA